MISETMRIEEIVKLNPSTTELFTDTGIDFCCGGHRVLVDVLEEKNLDVDSFMDLLHKSMVEKDERDWKKAIDMKADELIPYIVEKFHRKEEELIEKTDNYLNKILKVHYSSHGEELSKIYNIFLKLKGELSAHFAKEEKEVFPVFLEGDKNRIKELEDEHDAAGDLLKELEELTNGFVAPEDGCMTYRLAFQTLKDLVDDVHIHIFLENSVLFQKEAIA
ncbi:MAG: DUF542 domain-containing protein [Tissierellia bacterium]|nr:DUF542 domain-containing protein [Tissierellia bacterium]